MGQWGVAAVGSEVLIWSCWLESVVGFCSSNSVSGVESVLLCVLVCKRKKHKTSITFLSLYLANCSFYTSNKKPHINQLPLQRGKLFPPASRLDAELGSPHQTDMTQIRLNISAELHSPFSLQQQE